jgi:hypothetical protein
MAITLKSINSNSDPSVSGGKRAYGTFSGDGASTSLVIAHGLGQGPVVVQIFDSNGNALPQGAVSGEYVWSVQPAGTVTVTFATAPASGATYNFTIVG